jgi:hypothetical protein
VLQPLLACVLFQGIAQECVSIRDCHPGPPARSAAGTSGSSLTLICSFGRGGLRSAATTPHERVALEDVGFG